jgi:cyclophilin family peptidyl-prolyl cis-trans isomerase
LTKSYNLFGYVQTGMDVVLKIAKVAVDSTTQRPLAPVNMTTVTVQEKIS